MVRSKVRNLTNLYDALGEHCPMHPEDVTDANFLDYAFMTKQLVLDVARRFRRDFEQTQRIECTGELPFIDFFKNLFGGNLERIIQYGSSVNGGGKDIDLMVLLSEITRATYDSIWDQRDKVGSEKPVGIVLLPSDGLTAYAECDYHSLTIARE